MKSQVERKMSNIESSLDRKMTRMEEKTEQMQSSEAGSWKKPFLFLVVIILAAGAGLYKFYRNLLKRHIL